MSKYQICTRCVMDTSATDIHFDSQGVCNYCNEFLERSSHILFQDPAMRDQKSEAFIQKVKKAGAGKRYDCIVGLSGGVDSAWALYLAVKSGLRPLAVHMDNGWNSELAQHNIKNLVSRLGVELYTYVIDWNEYRGLMQAFFDGDVIDVELLYDNAMLAVNYQLASKNNIKFILAGHNQSTEGMKIPSRWNWFKYDKRNIYALQRKFKPNTKIKTYPSIGTIDYLYYRFVRRIRWISFLDFFDYNKALALETLKAEIDYKPYPYKHYESVFTRFYQGYLLPQKFGVDKRRLHLSTLIVSNQMSREQALELLVGIPYPSESALEEDIQYFLKKMGWNRAQLDEYTHRPEAPHAKFGTEKPLWVFASDCYWKCIQILGKPSGKIKTPD